MRGIRKFIRRYFPLDKFVANRSYSQEGEDMVLRSFYEANRNYKGFYIDVGAHHPFRFSNTQYFYKRGWRGINIEPNPRALRLFKLFRRRDINLNLGISLVRQKLRFYCFNEPALNGFSKEISEARNNKNNYKIIDSIEVQTYPLGEVLDRYMPANQRIDFLSIDAEGLDFEVLKSNNWQKYKPQYILVEHELNLEQIDQSNLYLYLRNLGYRWVAKTKRTLFFEVEDRSKTE